MFDSLEEQMKRDQKGESTTKFRVLLYLAITGASILVLGGIVAAVEYAH